MHNLLARLRAALTPQAIALLCALMLLITTAGRERSAQGKTALEMRIEHALSAMESVDEISVVIHTMASQSDSGSFSGQRVEEIPVGVVAVAKGEADPILKLEIQEALCTLLGLPVSAVSVIMGGM